MVPSSKSGVGSVMLGQVASLDMAGGPAVIDRFNRSRNVQFEVELSGLPLGDVTAAVQKLPTLKNLPAGVKEVTIGDAEVMGELFASFGLAMLTGVLCIYIVLVLLFKDFLQPVTILAALPLALASAPANVPTAALIKLRRADMFLSCVDEGAIQYHPSDVAAGNAACASALAAPAVFIVK